MENYSVGDVVVRRNPADNALYQLTKITDGKTACYELQSKHRKLVVAKTGLRKADGREVALGKKLDLRMFSTRRLKGQRVNNGKV
ncbi:TPA: hypothetical protein NM870_003478 [Acinetobacter baumannii]|nr:hypothetical protein [Acinetobacter baumannii]